MDVKNITSAWDNKGDIVIGNDVWIGFEAVILSGVTIDDGAIIGALAEKDSFLCQRDFSFPTDKELFAKALLKLHQLF